MPTAPPPRRFRIFRRGLALEPALENDAGDGVGSVTVRRERRSRSKARRGFERLVVLSRMSSGLGIHSSLLSGVLLTPGELFSRARDSSLLGATSLGGVPRLTEGEGEVEWAVVLLATKEEPFPELTWPVWPSLLTRLGVDPSFEEEMVVTRLPSESVETSVLPELPDDEPEPPEDSADTAPLEDESVEGELTPEAEPEPDTTGG